MARLILFGGGDAGGILITANGVKPIPPYDPRLRLQLRAVAGLLHGSVGLPTNARHEMEGLAAKAAALVVSDLAATYGPLEGDHAVAFFDPDGGFTCGSTGKPFPFPWPPHGPQVRIDTRTMERDAALVERATVKVA